LTDKRKAWLVMVVVFLASIAIATNRFKAPPVLPTLMAELQVDMVTGGWLVSASSVAGIFLSIPAAILLNRMGLKLTGLLALGCAILGPVVGALANGPAMLLTGGIIEGVGATLISVVAPVAISLWFPLEDRGLPMGIWAGWVPVGNVIAFNIAHPLADAFGWRSIWWFGAAFSFIALVLFALVVRPPSKKEVHAQKDVQFSRSFVQGLLNPSAWLLGLGFGTFAFGLLGYNSWAPTFLATTLDINPAVASSFASLMFLAAIPANIVAGWSINRIRRPHRLLPVAFILMGILFFWGFRLDNRAVIAPYMIALGFISNFIPTTIFTLAPETASDPASASLALGIVNVGSNIGANSGPPALGAILSGGNWQAGGTGLVIVTIVGTILSWCISKRLKRNDNSR
jgi:predicted MFS family arabinose efflux permease